MSFTDHENGWSVDQPMSGGMLAWQGERSWAQAQIEAPVRSSRAGSCLK